MLNMSNVNSFSRLGFKARGKGTGIGKCNRESPNKLAGGGLTKGERSRGPGEQPDSRAGNL